MNPLPTTESVADRHDDPATTPIHASELRQLRLEDPRKHFDEKPKAVPRR